jgi:NAD(P)H dehydrogenase (quinone)
MKYLIIYAHPHSTSFNHAIREEIEIKLKKEKKQYDVRDLYGIKFTPALSEEDLVAVKQGRVPLDVKREQEFIKNSDVLVFVHPIWWFGMPAILKGYIDRVFSYGFAYAVDDKGIHGLLPDKKVVIFNTTGGPEDNYMDHGFNDAIKKTIEAGVFEFCAMKIVLHKYFYAVPTVTQEERVKMLEDIKTLSF